MGHPGGQPGIGAVEAVHPILISRENHHHLRAAVFHLLQQDLNRLSAVIAFVVGLVEVVGLINEQHTALGPLEHLFGLGRRVTHVLPHQIIPSGRHYMAFAEVTEAMQDLRHPLRHGGLTRPGIAGERHVEAWRSTGQFQLLPRLIHQQQRCNFTDPGLHRGKADQLTVELVQHLSHAGFGVVGRQINRGGHRSERQRRDRLRSTGHRDCHPPGGS